MEKGADKAEPDDGNGGNGVDAKAVSMTTEKKDWGPTLLEAARRLALSFGGAVPLPLLAADQQVLEIGRGLLERQTSGTGLRLSLRKLLEDACADAPRGTGVEVRQESNDPYPLVVAETEEEVEAAKAKSSNGSGTMRGIDDDEDKGGATWRTNSLDEVSSWHSGTVEGRRLRLTPAAATGGGGAIPSPDGGGGGGGNSGSGSGKGLHVAPVRPMRAKRSRQASPWRNRGRRGRRRGNNEDSFVKMNGIELAIVCGNVPVITLEKGTSFDLNASWLLQNAMGSHAKADSLYESCPTSPHERRIVSECIRRGLATSEIELWIVMARGREECVAVGTCGKRSMMLSLVVALALHSGDGYKLCLEELESLSLREPFEKLVSTAKRLASWGGGHDSQGSGSEEDGS